ncbi:hypothetical protein ABI_29180 [Asticcacaulis biprosthecium C19]|uniref:Uncharacterized protein n=1 Tax=Asticcacaulis biprosthecium C19 TaxID=715226 RepID=F4QMR0_9CAUL|nr:hypothetical protein ABI_29180 [Asticcacaulis biprosthecium C19]
MVLATGGRWVTSVSAARAGAAIPVSAPAARSVEVSRVTASLEDFIFVSCSRNRTILARLFFLVGSPYGMESMQKSP